MDDENGKAQAARRVSPFLPTEPAVFCLGMSANSGQGEGKSGRWSKPVFGTCSRQTKDHSRTLRERPG